MKLSSKVHPILLPSTRWRRLSDSCSRSLSLFENAYSEHTHTRTHTHSPRRACHTRKKVYCARMREEPSVCFSLCSTHTSPFLSIDSKKVFLFSLLNPVCVSREVVVAPLACNFPLPLFPFSNITTAAAYRSCLEEKKNIGSSSSK